MVFSYTIAIVIKRRSIVVICVYLYLTSSCILHVKLNNYYYIGPIELLRALALNLAADCSLISALSTATETLP